MPLTSSPEQPQPLRNVVSALKDWVERTSPIWVEGQIIELRRRAGAGTHFLKLRDKLAEVSVSVSTSTDVLDAAGPLTEGTLVTAWVRPTLWQRSGSLTFECREIRPSGEGRLLAHLEQRKRALQAEGLFSPELKKRLPFLPRVIGLVTGEGSAAERDVIENIRRRWPGAALRVEHALMQGDKAALQVAEAVTVLDRDPAVEVIIVARGGGSLEDLLPFSDEGLVRAVFAARTPVVSAIGHEPDTPILDLVADLRASTPTDAAKRVVPDAQAESAGVAQARARLRQAVSSRVATEERRLADLRSRPVLRDPGATIDIARGRVDDLTARLRRAIASATRSEQQFVEHTLARVRTLSPKATLQRGYAIVTTDDGATVTSIGQVSADDVIVARLLDGDIAAAVIDVEPYQPRPEEDA
ncbi:exodeoxyribonuclease VII large subunit [Nigerium massiliense]|uniref:exodeoxyribonuclease VII large subunit n=1 Tax=Nigerium massiliense TaxID=1522317 RepID=UPI00058F33FD|nr:exodeoxyribonuclease VII large subunit [Nigerium massiliense]